MFRCLSIGFREHDLFVQTLEFPSVLNEVRSQPVQKLRVGGFLPLGAEIVRITRQRFPKMPLPYPVDDGSSGQRILGVGNPFGEGQPSSGIFGSYEIRLLRVIGACQSKGT